MAKQIQVSHSDVVFKGRVKQVVSTLTVTTGRETRPFTQPTPSGVASTSSTTAVVPSQQPH